MNQIQLNKNLVKRLCMDGTPVITERTIFKDKLIFLGYVDLNEIQENTLFHFKCPINYFVIFQSKGYYKVILFDTEKKAKNFYIKEINKELKND